MADRPRRKKPQGGRRGPKGPLEGHQTATRGGQGGGGPGGADAPQEAPAADPKRRAREANKGRRQRRKRPRPRAGGGQGRGTRGGRRPPGGSAGKNKMVNNNG